MKIFTKEGLIEALKEIRDRGWIESVRPGNAGGVGNTLETLLGIDENNLPIPNAAEWELKCQRKKTTALTTLFHLEPSPQALKFVSNILLPKYGWSHKEAGSRYTSQEKSFRQTINALARSDRGFGVIVDRPTKRVLVSFDANAAAPRHDEWLSSVQRLAGSGEIDPAPYWGFDDLFHKAGTKLLNCFYVRAQVKRERGKEFFWYSDIMILQGLSIDKFLEAIENGYLLVDFDARTGHNHGTKFRLRQDMLPTLYDHVVEV